MSNVGAINNAAPISVTSAVAASTSAKAPQDTSSKEAAESPKTESGVVYEKGSSTVNTSYVKKNSALIRQLKADSDARLSQMKSLVEKMMGQQGAAIGKADSMWRFLASGKFTVSADVKAQAQADIAEDGYWGVEQTSDRIVDFAKALAGGDPAKADEMLKAFEKGFKAATKSWGKDLPDISQRTYDAVHKKFDAWKNEANSKIETE